MQQELAKTDAKLAAALKWCVPQTAHLELARALTQLSKAKKQRDKSRSKLLQRDRRGQPKAKHLIEHLLSRIEASRE